MKANVCTEHDSDDDCVVVWEYSGYGDKACPLCQAKTDYDKLDEENKELEKRIKELESEAGL